MASDFFWRQPFQHDSSLGYHGHQNLGFLGGGTSAYLDNQVQLHREVGRNSWGWGQQGFWVHLGNGWTILGNLSRVQLENCGWLVSSCRFSLVHCRTLCPKGSLEMEQLLPKLEVSCVALSFSLLS